MVWSWYNSLILLDGPGGHGFLLVGGNSAVAVSAVAQQLGKTVTIRTRLAKARQNKGLLGESAVTRP
jgi:hypothetical protein